MALRFLVLPILTVTVSAGTSAQEPRPFTVHDAVEMAYFGNIFDSSPDRSYDDGSVSPDGRFAISITHRGVLPEGLTEGTIWMFDVADVINSIQDEEATPSAPLVLARMSAAINGYSGDFRDRDNILLHPKWSDDGQSVFFLGRDGHENRQIFRVDVGNREVTALSPTEQDVMAYAVNGGHVAYLAGPNVDVDELWRAAGADIPDIAVGSGTPLISLLFPNSLMYANVESLDLEVWRLREGSAEPVRDGETGSPLQVAANIIDADISISPDGTQAVAVISEAREPFDTSNADSYRIIDLRTGSFRDSADLEAAGLGWTPFAQRDANDSSGVQFQVSEGLNEPPVLVATISETGESRIVLDPNPQLADISLLPVDVFEWEDRHGRTNTGGLIRPANFDPGRRYPLVVQTHGFRRDRFFRVGYSDTATAGRALASRNIVVLQADEAALDIDNPPINIEETGLDVYLGGIDKLAADGVIDAARVGISGYSFSGLTAAASIAFAPERSIAFAPERFSAAVIANADPLTMTAYFSYVDSPLHGVTERFFVGAGPFDDGLQTWIDRSPSLSVSSITAPVLVSVADPLHLLSLWDFYAALRYQDKPVELQYIRSGKHNIAKPLHKVAHQEMMVDWFDFWLNDHEDPDLGKSDQYRRWRDLVERVE